MSRSLGMTMLMIGFALALALAIPTTMILTGCEKKPTADPVSADAGVVAAAKPKCTTRACALAEVTALDDNLRKNTSRRGAYFDLYTLSSPLTGALEREDCDALRELLGAVDRVPPVPDIDAKGMSARIAGYCEGRPDVRPVTTPAKDAQLQMIRAGCYGECATYAVIVKGDGSVTYEGKKWVGNKGMRKAQLEARDVEALFASFEHIDFDSSPAKLGDPSTDRATVILTRIQKGITKTVTDHGACGGGESKSLGLCYLQTRLDEVARTDRWVIDAGPP